MIPLGLLSAGEQGEIAGIKSNRDLKPLTLSSSATERGATEFRVEEMGLRIGKQVEMLNNGGRTVLVRVDESRIAVDRGLAMNILIRR